MSTLALHWDTASLWERLNPLLPGIGIEVVPRIASTNSALLERAHVVAVPASEDAFVQVRRSVESAAFGRRAVDLQPCLLVAEHQTAGRGRQGRHWEAAPVASLTFSLSLPLAPVDWSGLSLAVGVALAEALEPMPGASPRLQVKWPNDIWLMDSPADASVDTAAPGRKLCGTLIETVAAGRNRLAVVGIGLNVLPLQAPDARNGVAALQELDAGISAPLALSRIVVPLVEALQLFERNGFAAFAERFAARDMLRGRAVRTTQAGLAAGTALGVSANGALRVKDGAGLAHEISSGEVSVRPVPVEGASC